MDGNIQKQISKIIGALGLKEHGASKHQDRVVVKKDLHERGIAPTKHNIAKETGFYATGSMKNTYATWRELGRFMQENTGSKDFSKMSNRTIEKYLDYKIEMGIKKETYDNIKSHVTKLEGALSRYADLTKSGKSFNFDRPKAFMEEKADRELEKGIAPRAYDRPQDLVDRINNEKFQIAASIQLEAGARINEASLITRERLAGVQEYRGKEVGVIQLQRGDAKGGAPRPLYVSKETYTRLSSYVQENGKLHIDRNTSERQEYRNAIKEAAHATGQEYKGSHGLRHNFAQARVEELQREHRMGYSVSLTTVSVEMGHFREDITEHYLKSAA
jgi:integrase